MTNDLRERMDVADFKKDYAEALSPYIHDDEFARLAWGALANVTWYHPSTQTSCSLSLRVAGGFIAEIRNDGSDYLTWYCSSNNAVVPEKIRRLMRKRGWIFDADSDICDEPDCLKDASCGWRSDSGYRHTCGEHWTNTPEASDE